MPSQFQLIIGSLLNPDRADHQRISTNISSCDDGQMRDQVTIKNKRFAWQPNEPNPNVNQYLLNIPTYWWLMYTHWWHETYNDDARNNISCSPVVESSPLSGVFLGPRCS